jgi:peptide deformylase
MLSRSLVARRTRMTVRDGVNLAHFPHSSLTTPAARVAPADFTKPSFPLQIQRLHDAANRMQCLSFSAPKIKWDVQVILIKATPDVDDYEIFVNPEVPGYDDRRSIAPMLGMWENDVSCASLHAWVIRPRSVSVTAQDEYGDTRTELLDGMRARLLMHELDVLRGTSFMQQAPSTDFVVSSSALAQQELWPAHFPSAEARMTGMNQCFDYVTNTVVTPPGMEWVAAIQASFIQFQSNRLRGDTS